MTYKGMHRENVSQAQSYILIPESGNKLPERIEASQALKLVQNNIDQDDRGLHNVFDRIQDDERLTSCVRGMTGSGLLIYGTMDDAFALSHKLDRNEFARAEAAPASNVTFLGDIRNKFKGSVHHYTGRAVEGLQGISNAFDGFAGVATAQRAHAANEPKFALAA